MIAQYPIGGNAAGCDYLRSGAAARSVHLVVGP
jgi:hypothetical protein